MDWRTANTLGVSEDRPHGVWTRDELDLSLEQEHKADCQLNKMLGARKAVETKKALGIKGSPDRGEYPCPECDSVLATPGARGAHLKGRHGVPGSSPASRYPRHRSLHVA